MRRRDTLLALLPLAGCGGGGATAATAPTVATPAAPTAPTPPATTGMRDLTSLQLSRLMGAGWNLGNSLEAIGGETAWGNPAATQTLMTAVKAAGFRTVRLPVSWKQYADASDNIKASWLARVAEVVGFAQTAGLIVIINVHWDGGWLQPTYAAQAAANARLTKFWTQIANHFKGYDDTLLFAGTNEVMVEGDYGTPTTEYVTVQNGFNQQFVSAVRATGGNNAVRHLVVQGFNTNIDYTLAFAVLPTDTVRDRLMMEVHYYDPYDFTLNDKSSMWQWGTGATDTSAKVAGFDEAWADAQFQKMKTRHVDKGIPVILGEFGAMRRTEYAGAEAYRLAWDRYIARSAWTHGLVPVYWDAGAATENHSMGLFNRATGAQVYPELIKALVDSAN